MVEIRQALLAGVVETGERKQIGIPENVNAALLPSIQVKKSEKPNYEDRHFDIAVKDVPAKTFFMSLIKGTDYNMMINPKIKGTITLNLKNVTIPQVMGAVRDLYHYEYKVTASGFQVLPNDLQSRIFRVNYLNVKREGKSSTSISSGQISNKVSGGGGGNNSSSSGSSNSHGLQKRSN